MPFGRRQGINPSYSSHQDLWLLLSSSSSQLLSDFWWFCHQETPSLALSHALSLYLCSLFFLPQNKHIFWNFPLSSPSFFPSPIPALLTLHPGQLHLLSFRLFLAGLPGCSPTEACLVNYVLNRALQWSEGGGHRLECICHAQCPSGWLIAIPKLLDHYYIVLQIAWL